MTGLFRSEVLRLTSRRTVRLVAVVFLGILLVVQVAGAIHSKPGEEALRQAQIEAEEIQRESVEMCERMKVRGDIGEDQECVGGYVVADDPRYRADQVLPAMAKGLAVAASLVAFGVGASYVGADWSAGTMQSLLFWEPRRQRVVLVKALALVAVLLAFTAVVQAVGWATTMLVAATRGTTDGVTGGVHQSAFLTMLRGMVVVTFTGLLGYAVAGLARLQAVALGAAFGYFAVVENVVRNVRPGWTRYLVTENVIAVLDKLVEVPTGQVERFDEYYETHMFVLSGARGAVTLAVYLALLLGLFALSFSRRDVT